MKKKRNKLKEMNIAVISISNVGWTLI